MNSDLLKKILLYAPIPVLILFAFIVPGFPIKMISFLLVLLYGGYIALIKNPSQRKMSVDENVFKPVYNTEIKNEEPAPNEINENVIDEEESEFTVLNKPVEVEPVRQNILIKKEIIEDEGFVIVSGNNKAEYITQPDFISDKPRENFFRPNNFKELFLETVYQPIPEEFDSQDQFNYMLEKYLLLIKNSFSAYSVVFFFYNEKKERLILHKFVSDSKEIIDRKFDIENDILSLVIKNHAPEIRVDILSTVETENLRYYSTSQGVKSVLAVPIFHDNKIVAVLAIDSIMPDAYGTENAYQLGEYVKIIAYMIKIFEDKHAENILEGRLNSIMNILGSRVKNDDDGKLFREVLSHLEGIISWDAATLIIFDVNSSKFVINSVANKTSLKYVGENLEIENAGTITGKALFNGKSIVIEDFSTLSPAVRYNKSEDVTFDGSFVVVPLIYKDQIFGAICLEAIKKFAFASKDVDFLTSFSNFWSYVVYSDITIAHLRGLMSEDDVTKTMNKRSFLQRVSEELLRAQALNVAGTFALIRLDDFDSEIAERISLDSILASIVKVIKENINVLDVIGRIGRRTIGIYFFNKETKEIFLWADKIRVNIARKTFSYEDKQFSATVSIGLCNTREKIDLNQITEEATMTLNKALEKGGNKVHRLD